MDTEKENYYVLEWTIENFSCWNNELHEKTITSTKSVLTPEESFELYPRGLSGQDEHLEVLLHHSKPSLFLGELSFIGSDGSPLCTQQTDSEDELEVLVLCPGPKFEEVVAQIRKNEPLHKDRLTLRWRFKCAWDFVEYMRTTINKFDVNFKISPKTLHNLTTTGEIISYLKLPVDEEEMVEMILKIAKDENDHSKIVITLIHRLYKKNVSVLTRMSVLKDEDVVRTEENDHLFRDDDFWNFCNSLAMEEIEKEGSSLNLYLKIIPSGKYKQCLTLFQKLSESVHVTSTWSIKPSDGTSPSSSTTTVTSNRPENSVAVLAKDFMCLYQDQDFSDFQLKCGDVSFPVHRNVLSARSPVFKTMLSTDMRETASGCADIEDMDPSTIGLFLTYLYTGTAEQMQCDSALKLYYAADKYQVPTLKRECADFLSAEVSLSNVCDILSLADKHRDGRLTSVAHDFMLKNYSEVLRSGEWKIFMKSEPLLAVETLTLLSERREK